MNGAFFQRAGDARDRMPIGFIGDFVRSHDFRSVTGINADPQRSQVTTIAVPSTVDTNADYVVTINGVACTFETGGATTQDELGAGLESAINANPAARRLAVASYDASGNVLTLTGVWPGVAFAVAVNSAVTTNDLGTPSTTAAADADAVDFGRAVIQTGTSEEGQPLVAVPTTSHFTAQVVTLTFAGNTASYYHGSVHINGRVYPWGGVVWTSDLDTTCTAIAAAINAVMPAETVIAASVGSASGEVTLTAEVEGAEFEADAHAQGHADAEATKAYTTGPSPATSLKRAMVGISVRRLDVENQTVHGNDPAYAPNQGVEVCTRGKGVLQRDTSENWAFGDEVFVSLASATKGRLYNSAGTDRVWLGRSPLVIERGEHSTSSDGVGVIRVDMGA